MITEGKNFLKTFKNCPSRITKLIILLNNLQKL